MKTIHKRMGSLLLAAAMVITFMPATAWAQEPVQDSGIPSVPAIGDSHVTGSDATSNGSVNTLSISVSEVTDSSATLSYTGSTDGTVYYLVQQSEEGTPNEATILAGKTVTVVSGAAVSANVTELMAESEYTAYALLESRDGSRSTVASAQFATEVASAPTLRSVAFAAPAGTPYVDEKGDEYIQPATELTSTTTTLTDGWYVVNGDVTYTYLHIEGNVSLILADSGTLTVKGEGITLAYGSLTIYGQTKGTGQLNTEGTSGNAGIFCLGDVTINGGVITAKSDISAGIGIRFRQTFLRHISITINRGTVTAMSVYGAGIGDGGELDYNDMSIIINGGTVIATSVYGAGIGGGYHTRSKTSISINGGTVDASSVSGAGIGRGADSIDSIITSVTVTGGQITAESNSGPGIGGDYVTIAITGGDVTASSFSSATDTEKPTIQSVFPDGTDISISGNIVITFNDEMMPSAGTVSLNKGAIVLPRGSWDVDRKVYTVPYDSLTYGTEYTIEISGFRDVAGNIMTNASYRFTTKVEPLPPSVSVNSLTVNKGDTVSFNVFLGQGVLAASGASITVADSSIAAVSTDLVTASEIVTATGLTAGTTLITIAFDDLAATVNNIAVTVTNSTPSTGGNGSGVSSSITPEKQPDYPVTAELSVTATIDKNGHATAKITKNAIADAIKRASEAAKSQGKTDPGIGISVIIQTSANTNSLGFVLTQSVLRQLVDAKVQQFEVNGKILTLSLDQEAIRQLQTQSTGDVTVTVKPVTVVGVRNAYEITFTTVKDGRTVSITSLGSGRATLSHPYMPGKKEEEGYLYAVYVDQMGNINRIDDSAYDTGRGSMIYITNHFSIYGVSYTAPSASFKDISFHWYKESIDYGVGRGLFGGITDTTFAPDTAMTRAMLVTALGRLAGVDTKAYTTSSFIDVIPGSAFQPYIEWAYKKGIMQGTDNGKFEPERAITREEIAVIFANYSKVTGYTLPVTREATTYADAFSISSTYKTAVMNLQQAGVMMGGTNNFFNPKSDATRAEVSAMLHRYIKLTIDPTTAQGWELNDVGQYIYYKDGKVLTGIHTINGTKYYFNTDGTLKTGWVKDDAGNRYFYSGNVLLTGWWSIHSNGSGNRYYFTKDGIMIAGKWLELDGKWYYFNADGSLAVSTTIDGYKVDKNGVRKAK